jgi:hypothetical protein
LLVPQRLAVSFLLVLALPMLMTFSPPTLRYSWMGLAILVPQFLDENRFGSHAATVCGQHDT